MRQTAEASRSARLTNRSRTLNRDAGRRGEFRLWRAAGVARPGRLEEDDLCFRIGDRPMFDTTRDDEKFSRAQLDRALAKFHPHLPAPDKE